jgi:hypothetical protein
MVFGHNSNVKVGDTQYHVQTEDRGASHAVIDTMVYQSGRVLHRRADSYADLLPLDAHREEVLKDRVSTQHQAVLEELRSGALKFAEPAKAPAAAPAKNSLGVELLNAQTWLAAKRATLKVSVFQKGGGQGISGAHVIARIEGAAEPAQFSTATGLDGTAQLAFDMPALTGGDCVLVIEATHGKARAGLRFQLRAKPKVPAAG